MGSHYATAQSLETIKQLAVELGEGFLELLWPTRCIGCEETGILLCDQCNARLPRIDRSLACPHCGAPLGHIICTECYGADGPREFSFSQAVAAMEFQGTAARLVVGYKDQHERRLAQLLAQLLLQVIPDDWIAWTDVITYIPADARALRQRGFDHMQAVASALAALMGQPAANLLVKYAVTDQRLLGRAARQQNSSAAFSARFSGECHLPPGKVLLIDDVLTTGATLDAAATTLLDAGFDEVRVAVIARVW